ncbi:DUF5655 domain-containing protein [Clostridium sp. K04]|uniref:DUF5655 domain-containing protein n=1 Tax=Clostridium sp. K04 TaxID=2718929 RepID=UPI001C8BE93F|nr:DUF5655 domain-containing protein [Clostridium sp. K04]MBX9184573.1 hypothetical protein [Clostridium sp. K04]
MILYNINNENLEEIKEVPFSKEIELHKLCEKNLEELFGLEFVKREVTLNNFRIDTLAFDKNTNSFIIIEYKNTRNFSVIDQGYAYLSLLVNNKAEFILEYNENCNNTLKRDDIDWSQSRVIFVSPEFNNYQKESINFRDLPFELWEVKKFSNNTVSFNPIKVSRNAESIKTIETTSEVVKSVNKEIKVYKEENLLNNSPEEIKEIYNEIKEYILTLDGNINIKCTGVYIGFRLNNKNIVDIYPMKKKIKVWLNCKWESINDYKKIARDVSNIGHWGNGDYEVVLTDKDDLDYLFDLIKQVYKLRKL